ncbi:hypothetical protein LY78DRAFT_439378 [Colletotrichum sublineola]|nr:hypothetical protein LY78DRAFT_439378 [Colletotrichum sublineola]
MQRGRSLRGCGLRRRSGWTKGGRCRGTRKRRGAWLVVPGVLRPSVCTREETHRRRSIQWPLLPTSTGGIGGLHMACCGCRRRLLCCPLPEWRVEQWTAAVAIFADTSPPRELHASNHSTTGCRFRASDTCRVSIVPYAGEGRESREQSGER